MPSNKLLSALDQTDTGDGAFFDVNTSVDALINRSNSTDKKNKHKIVFGSR